MHGRRKRAPKSCAHTLSCALENSGPEKSRILNKKTDFHLLKAHLWAEHRSSHAESRFPLPVQPGLGFALGLRAAGTIARLLLQGSATVGMSLLNRSCVQLEFGAAGESSSSSEFTQLLRGSVHVGPCTAAALASSSHTTTSSLCRAHSPFLCGVLLSTGWYCWRFDFRPPRGPWECKLHMWLTVPAIQCLEQDVAGTTIRARLSGSTVVCNGLWAFP